MRRKRVVKRYRKNGNNNTSYLIIILLCLITLNLGVLLFRIGSNNERLKELNILRTVIEKLNSSGLNIISSKDDDTQENNNEIDESVDIEDERSKSEDYIISRLEEYESLIVVKDSTGNNQENIPEPLNIKKLSINKDSNYILMYHTHATESYLVDDEDVYHNPDTSKNVVLIGDTIQKVLEVNGHKVDHVQTLHDLPSYNKSYSRSLNTINNKKNENKNLKVFFDIHRDGVDKDASYKDNFLKTARIDINGISTATFSLVIGPDTPNYESVLSFAKYIKAVSDTLYPGFCTGIIIKPTGKYNLYASDYSALVEVGSNLVTIEEANESAKLIGEILGHVLDRIIE